ncbi:hypothetical protein [Candidatus Nitronereus thalassa]|uniref:Apea-like HEPN domain-containing protein n=1 Tax=Candidatus Nitronereus thalassa TaxID=3020898 RepID=A0ABU3K6L9_9BACT|nr:hypothetical protein [Candidatus Nitronereus thalassa]MDT7042079.1 hypothetical protein [Candidatus Nitronereus thalassa]
MELEVYQFISRKNVENRSLGGINTSPKQRPDLKFQIQFEIIDKSFEVNFAQLIPSSPSAGAYEYIDPYVDVYMKERWPKCIKGKANLNIASSEQLDNEILKMVLPYLRFACWHLKEHVADLKKDKDQFSTQKAYRREYLGHQMFDFDGNRRPSASEKFCLTDIGEYIGPGVASIVGHTPFGQLNEFVWSQIMPIENPTDVATDLPRIREKLNEIRKHYNTYNELNDARRLLSNGELRSAIRAAASSIDAILRYYCVIWGAVFPAQGLQFHDKIEKVLQEASKPSFKKLDPANSQKLLYLYRARNSMHEGDCYYKDNSGKTVNINKRDQVGELVRAAEEFTLWMDSLV